MATHDYEIDNATSATVRGDINSVLQAILTHNSSATAPGTVANGMIWYDTTNEQLKARIGGAWITLGTFDTVNSKWNPNFFPATEAQAQAGTNNSTVMTPLRVSQAITALAPNPKNPFETLTAGTNIRSRIDTAYSRTTSQGQYTVHQWSFLQFGTLRVSYDQRAVGGIYFQGQDSYDGTGECTVYIKRDRNGSTTTLNTQTISTSPSVGASADTGWTTRTYDASVKPGDILYVIFEHTGTATGTGTAYIRNTRFQTGGENLWPGPGETVLIEGNSAT